MANSICVINTWLLFLFIYLFFDIKHKQHTMKQRIEHKHTM